MKPGKRTLHHGGPLWLKILIGLGGLALAAMLVRSFFIEDEHSAVTLEMRSAKQKGKSAKSHAPTRPVRVDAIVARDSQMRVTADGVTVILHKGASAVPQLLLRGASDPTTDQAFMQRAISRIVNYPDAAEALGLTREQVNELRALNPTGRPRLAAMETERLRDLCLLWENAGGASEDLLGDRIIDTLRGLDDLKRPQMAQAADEAPGKFNAIITPERREKLIDILATPPAPPTRPAVSRPTRPATSRHATSRPASRTPATTRP